MGTTGMKIILNVLLLTTTVLFPFTGLYSQAPQGLAPRPPETPIRVPWQPSSPSIRNPVISPEELCRSKKVPDSLRKIVSDPYCCGAEDSERATCLETNVKIVTSLRRLLEQVVIPKLAIYGEYHSSCEAATAEAALDCAIEDYQRVINDYDEYALSLCDTFEEALQPASLTDEEASAPRLDRGRALRVRGSVRDRRGRSLNGTILVIRDGRVIGRAVTSVGSFSLYDLAPGRYLLQFRSDRGSAEREILLGRGEIVVVLGVDSS